MLSLVWCLQSLQDIDNVVRPRFQQVQTANQAAVPPEAFYAEPEDLVDAALWKAQDFRAVLM